MGPAPWGGGMADPLETRSSPYVLSNRISSIYVKPLGRKQGVPKFEGRCRGLLRSERDDPWKHASLPPVLPRQFRSFYDKPYERNYGDTPK